MFRRFLLAGGLISFFLNSISAQGDAPSGGVCKSDGDCMGNLDCIRTGLFEKRCFPVTCAKGAAQALLDFGFDSDAYVHKVMADAGFASKTDFVMMGHNASSNLSQALLVDVPPMHVFNENLTACMNPESRRRGLRKLQVYSDARTAYGLQWSAAALAAYFGKSTWSTIERGILNDILVQLVSNCVGFILGADAGVDFLIQIFSEPDGAFSGADNTTSKQISVTQNPGDTQYIPIITAGPFGIQVGWFQEEGADFQTITEITLGPSFGAALGGFTQCFNEATYTSVE
jgi:hypothetical protein